MRFPLTKTYAFLVGMGGVVFAVAALVGLAFGFDLRAENAIARSLVALLIGAPVFVLIDLVLDWRETRRLRRLRDG